MRLIDADAIQIPSTCVDMFENCRNCKLLDEDQVREIIDNAPTIEPKRGHWIETPHNEKCKYIVCSECGNRYAVDVNIPLEVWIDGKHRFCGSCNADMRGKDDE